MKSMTVEWAKYNHRFLAIAPGPIADSGGSKVLDPLGLFKKFNDIHNPRNRMCKPSEIAELACYLTSHHADYINGTVIRIDGGELNANSGEFNFLRYVPFSGI
jgi:NAD(P)-dependent dehydrogenase (short-subunit alcohol dehydrogenase family)